MTANAFYLKTQVCYGDSCQDADVRWVFDFDTAEKTDSVVMLYHSYGSSPAGVYVNMDSRWHLVLSYADATELFSSLKSDLKIVIHATTVGVYPDATVFRNAQKQVTPTVLPSDFDFWAVVTPAEVSPSGTVTRPANSAGPGIIQISNGADTTITDFVPPVAGVVTTDENGVASARELVELKSGGGLSLGYLVV